MLAAPSTEVGSIPSFIIIAANGVPGQDRLADDDVLPSGESALGIQSGIELVEVHRTI